MDKGHRESTEPTNGPQPQSTRPRDLTRGLGNHGMMQRLGLGQDDQEGQGAIGLDGPRFSGSFAPPEENEESDMTSGEGSSRLRQHTTKELSEENTTVRTQ